MLEWSLVMVWMVVSEEIDCKKIARQKKKKNNNNNNKDSTESTITIKDSEGFGIF